jgi:hypothetical protein
MGNCFRKLGVLAAVVVLAACETVAPTIDTGASAEQMSYDGLYPVKSTRVDHAWARSDLDLTGYNKFLLQSAGIHYRLVKASAGGRHSSRSGSSGFPIKPENRERLRKELQDAFLDELGKSDRIDLVTEPGPDVLIFRAAMLDVVSHVPPEQVGRGGIYINSVGEGTLVIELADSETNAILVRAMDRRAAEQHGNMIESSSVTTLAEVRRLARTWARMLRARLENVVDDMLLAEGG